MFPAAIRVDDGRFDATEPASTPAQPRVRARDPEGFAPDADAPVSPLDGFLRCEGTTEPLFDLSELDRSSSIRR